MDDLEGTPRFAGEWSEVKDTLDRLASLSSGLSRLGTVIVGLSIIHILIPLLAAIGRQNQFFGFPRYSDQYWVLSVIDLTLFFGVFVVLVDFDRLSKRGHVLFQEISDSLEWKRSEDVSISARITMRQFVLDATLPFDSGGRHGAAIYLALNLLVSIVVWVLLLLSR